MTTTATTELRAFHGDPKIKRKYLARVRAHRAADQIVHGIYWEHGKGCAVGCTVHSGDHFAYERELGIPAWLAFLEDRLFEAMGNGRAKDWPVEFIEAIPVGAGLSFVLNQFMAWLMVDEKFGLINVTRDDEMKDLIREVARRYLTNETTGAEAEALADRLRARVAWEAWVAWGEAWVAWEAREARGGVGWRGRRGEARVAWEAREGIYQKHVLASSDALLGFLRQAPVPSEATAA